ncbi:DUF1326 domain-containing protein [Paraburkholderia sp. MMS20-SJTR3]|uniref:DUF1326 domain-containing protein n=1 Tax=Paraburkholderia sejongensis TaxID=2886946 RepID=A0ABS8K2J3_9BURK|nr:DUF1326 domain-containing protein [Paraburkholderia sp. MMS20-SJTR3]MCC8396379.1 DUF1326 domain-containing protein [Paraburkholderia sp. MMS20-SJTR3]
MSYQLMGSILEVCECKVLCPCWIGEDPDNGVCRSALAYHYETGTIDGIDVSGLTVAFAAFIPGNVLKGGWRVAMFVDERASDAQFEAIVAAHSGKRGGPLADLVQLIGELVSVDRAAIEYTVVDGKGRMKVGETIDAELEPYRGPTGEPTKLVESIFSTIPGSPAFVGKANYFRLRHDKLDLDLSLSGHNAIQGSFSFES